MAPPLKTVRKPLSRGGVRCTATPFSLPGGQIRGGSTLLVAPAAGLFSQQPAEFADLIIRTALSLDLHAAQPCLRDRAVDFLAEAAQPLDGFR